MLQRVQTVFLLLAAACAGATWLFPVRTWRLGEGGVSFFTKGLVRADGAEVVDVSLPVPYWLLHSLLALVLLALIFLHGNRPRQARLVRGAWLTMVLVAVLQFISCNSMDSYFNEGTRSEGVFGASFYLPLGAILFSILAERAIKKDEALVRSADRLR